MPRDPMSADPDRFRKAVGSFLAEEASAAVDRWRGHADADSEDAVLRRHAFLGGRDAADVLGELSERGRVTPESAGALAAQLRRFTREQRFASVRRTLRDLQLRTVEVRGQGLPFRSVCREAYEPKSPDDARARVEAIERAARAAAPVLRERRIEAAEAAGARKLPSHRAPDAGPERAATVELAESVLASTRDLLEEGLDWLAHRSGAPVREAFDVPRALRAADLDDAFPADGRFRRLGALASGLGLHAELGRRVRVDVPHGSADPRARIALPRPPFDVRIAASSAELGAISELAAAHATGRALAACLAHPELPVELRYPIEGTVGRAMGALFAQWAFDDGRLARARRAPAHVLDRARRLAALVSVLSLRVAATATRLDPKASPEEAAEAAHRAIGVPCSPAIAIIGLHPGGAAPARLRGELGGLALWPALRDRYDEDWYRNPRVHDVVRGAGERGGALSIEALLAELGVAPTEGVARAAEWFRRSSA